MSARTLTLALAAAALLSACSRSDSPTAPKAKSSEAPVAAAPAPKRKSGEIDEALKERLARQEAAAKMFETKVLQPPAPRAPEPPPATKTPALAPPVAAAPASSPDQPAVAVRSVPAKAAPVNAPAPAAAVAAPAPRTDLATAAPTSAPAASAAPRLVARVDPDFPREAVQAGADTGNVRARMTLDGAGGVTRVEIVEAIPRRVFDRAVVRALSQWRYNAGPEGRTVDMEIAFKR